MFNFTNDKVQTFTTTSPQQTSALGEVVGAMIKSSDIVAYKGGMGMGKTTFTAGLVRGLECSMDVTSPTFALLNEYRGGKFPICHVDAFRLTNPDDLESIGFYEYVDNGWVILIEWSEQVYSAIPSPHFIIEFEWKDENIRNITITHNMEVEQ